MGNFVQCCILTNLILLSVFLLIINCGIVVVGSKLNRNPTLTFHQDTRFHKALRSLHNELFRRFAFPPGTFMIFEPELTLPAWREHPIGQENLYKSSFINDYLSSCQKFGGFNGQRIVKEDVDIAAVKNAAIQISSLFYVYFDKLGWTHEDSIYTPPQYVGSYIQEYLVDPTLQILGVPPQATGRQDAESKQSGHSVMASSDIHRLQLFQKIENLLEQHGAYNGRACLLRAICEVHEYPFDTGRLGIFGEVLALILSVSPSGNNKESNKSCLSNYARAEKDGKERNCNQYIKFCSQSIFSWYWKMTNLGAK